MSWTKPGGINAKPWQTVETGRGCKDRMKLAIKNDKPWQKIVKFEAHELTIFEFYEHKSFHDYIENKLYILSLNDYMYHKTIIENATYDYVQAYDEQTKNKPCVE